MKKVSFITEDNVKLDGLLYEPENIKEEVVISVHGMSSNCFKKREDIFEDQMVKNNISYFCFNNRGHDLAVYIDKYIDNKRTKIMTGTSYEDVLDSYYDVKAAIKTMIDYGYNKIHLQGHSLGCTKIIYTYNRLKEENNTEILNKISSIILLSLVDIIELQKYYLKDKYDLVLNYATQKKKENKEYELMPEKYFMHPISVKSYIRYFKDNSDIDFLRYSDDEYNMEKLNNISHPIFIRWGNDKELIIQDVKTLVKLLNEKIKNKFKDIGYIDGAGHGYDEKELVVSKEIINFIKQSKIQNYTINEC